MPEPVNDFLFASLEDPQGDSGQTAAADPSRIMLLVSVLLPPRALDDLGLLTEERTVRTPFGDVGPLARRTMADGSSHWVQPYAGLPTRTDPRATLYAARLLGVQRVLAWDFAIALDPAFTRGQSAIVVDAIDWTRHQPDTYFTSAGLEALRVESEESSTFCPSMTTILHRALPAAEPVVVVGVDGPRRETIAEARLFSAWDARAICQNVTPEAMLARELGLHFGAIATINAYSRDQQREAVAGDVRHGLEQVMLQLPDLLRQMQVPFPCRCAD